MVIWSGYFLAAQIGDFNSAAIGDFRPAYIGDFRPTLTMEKVNDMEKEAVMFRKWLDELCKYA